MFLLPSKTFPLALRSILPVILSLLLFIYKGLYFHAIKALVDHANSVKSLKQFLSFGIEMVQILSMYLKFVISVKLISLISNLHTGRYLITCTLHCGKHITDFTHMDAEISSAFRASYCKKPRTSMLTFNNNMPKSFGFESENNYFQLF